MFHHISAFLNDYGLEVNNFAKQKDRNSKGISRESKDFISLVKNWHEVVGVKLAENSRPTNLKGETLILLTKNPYYSHAIDLMKGEILQKINNNFPNLVKKVTNFSYKADQEFFLRLKEDKKGHQVEVSLEFIEKNKKIQKLNPYSPYYRKALKEAQLLTASFEDQELKKIIEELYVEKFLEESHEEL